jgi:hypothetical protein
MKPQTLPLAKGCPRTKMVENYITVDDIQRFRRPADFVSWFFRKLDEINSGEGVREQILLRQGIAKVVFEEVYPLYRLLQNKGSEWNEIEFRNVVGNQQFDVETTSEIQIVPHFMEITIADQNYEEHLRMRYLVDHGHVPLIGKVSHEGTKKRGYKIRPAIEMRLHTEINKNVEAMIKDAVALKCGKDYPKDTGLLVYFDDNKAFRNSDDTELMSSFIASLGDDWMNTFSHLFVVGATGSKVWSRVRAEQGIVLKVAPVS